MVLKNKRIGVAMTGSFCTYTKAFEQIDRLLEEGAILQTIFSDISQHIKCRFGKGEEFVKRAHDMTGNEPMKTIEEAEIIGPTGCLVPDFNAMYRKYHGETCQWNYRYPGFNGS